MEAGATPADQDKDWNDPRFQFVSAVDMPRYNRVKGEWYTATPPICRQSNNMGPVDFFGRKMIEELPEQYRVGVINVSVAGAKLELWDKDACEEYLAMEAADPSRNWLVNGYIEQGETVTKIVRIANVGNKSSRISVVTTGNRYGMIVECPESIAPQEVANLKITYRIPKGRNYYGMTRDTLWLVADGVKGTQPLAISAKRVEKVSNDENAPKPVMRIEPSYVDFGNKEAGKIHKKTITIENTGNADLIFRNVETLYGTAVSIESGQTIKPGASLKVTVAITAPSRSGESAMGSIYLTTNDPQRLFRELRLEVKAKN